jgi:hypothetical protein
MRNGHPKAHRTASTSQCGNAAFTDKTSRIAAGADVAGTNVWGERRASAGLAIATVLVVAGMLTWFLKLSIGVSVDRSFPRRSSPIADAGSDQ